MPSKPGSTLPKLGTCFVVGEMPGGKSCRFKVPSLERVLLLVLEGSSTPEHVAASDSTSSKLGTQILPPKFPGARPTTDRVPSLEQVLPS